MKKSTKEYLYTAQIKMCDDFSRYIHSHNDISDEELTKKWKEIFFLVTKCMGFKKKNRQLLWDNLAENHWEHFCQTLTERTWDRDRWLYLFSADLAYHSGCIDLGSLTKLHWHYRQIINLNTD